jgi:hypothetical protein
MVGFIGNFILGTVDGGIPEIDAKRRGLEDKVVITPLTSK